MKDYIRRTLLAIGVHPDNYINVKETKLPCITRKNDNPTIMIFDDVKEDGEDLVVKLTVVIRKRIL